MRTREPVPDRRDGGDHPQQEPPGQHSGSEHDLESGPSLTIAEAARLCGVSVSTIRRYLAAGRFPTAHQQPSPIPGQRGLWRIPTQDLLAAGLRSRQTRTPDQQQQHQPSRRRGTAQPADRVRELEHALALERTRRRAAEDLVAERAHTIQTLKGALGAL
jgi:excisionase family DNA binding protein